MYAPSRESSLHESYRQGVFFTNATTPFLGNAVYDFICGVEGTVILVCVFPDVCAPFRRTSMERFSTILRNSLLFWDFFFQLLNFFQPHLSPPLFRGRKPVRNSRFMPSCNLSPHLLFLPVAFSVHFF